MKTARPISSRIRPALLFLLVFLIGCGTVPFPDGKPAPDPSRDDLSNIVYLDDRPEAEAAFALDYAEFQAATPFTTFVVQLNTVGDLSHAAFQLRGVDGVWSEWQHIEVVEEILDVFRNVSFDSPYPATAVRLRNVGDVRSARIRFLGGDGGISRSSNLEQAAGGSGWMLPPHLEAATRNTVYPFKHEDAAFSGVHSAPDCPDLVMPLPGALQALEVLRDRLPGKIGSVGGFACRRSTYYAEEHRNPMSVHSTGRALDINVVGSTVYSANNANGDPLANWLVEHAEELGITAVIWDGMIWDVAGNRGRFQVYNGVHQHRDHIHVDFITAAANQQMGWYQSGKNVPERADYEVRNVTVNPVNVRPGDRITVTFEVVNIAQFDASANSVTNIRINRDVLRAIPTDPRLGSIDPEAPLKAQQKRLHSLELTVPTDAAAGPSYIWVTADAGSSLNQVDENNDKASARLIVSNNSSPTPLPPGPNPPANPAGLAVFPVDPSSCTPVITQGYGARDASTAHRLHTALDIGGCTGARVLAVQDGYLHRIQTGDGGGLGNMVELAVNIENRVVFVRYSHLLAQEGDSSSGFGSLLRDARNKCTPSEKYPGALDCDITGDKRISVKRGQDIGRVGATGDAMGPHLDFAVKTFSSRSHLVQGAESKFVYSYQHPDAFGYLDPLILFRNYQDTRGPDELEVTTDKLRVRYLPDGLGADITRDDYHITQLDIGARVYGYAEISVAGSQCTNWTKVGIARPEAYASADRAALNDDIAAQTLGDWLGYMGGAYLQASSFTITKATTTAKPGYIRFGWACSDYLTQVGSTPPTPGKGALAVSGSEGLRFEGQQGGPFTGVRGATDSFVVSNEGTAPLDWQVLLDSSWISASPSSGRLDPGRNTSVAIAMGRSAESLSWGTHRATATFSASTGTPIARTIILEVDRSTEPDPEPGGRLAVTPGSGVAFSGTEGGPFTPARPTYTLANQGTRSLAWSVTTGSNWFTMVPTSGTLAAGASTTVEAQLGSAAATLAAGTYFGSLHFQTDGEMTGSSERAVSLTITAGSGPGPDNRPPEITSFTAVAQNGWEAPAFVDLRWRVDDPDGDPVSCRLQYDTSGAQAPVNIENCKPSGSYPRWYNEPGTYQARIVAIDSQGLTTERTDSFTVTAPQRQGVLEVQDRSRWSARGSRQDGFSNSTRTYTLRNSGNDALDWALNVNDAGWVQATGASSGRLQPSQTTSVSLRLNSAVINHYEPGTYNGSIEFRDVTSRNSVLAPARLILEEDEVIITVPRTDLIRNGSFSNGRSSWSVVGDAWVWSYGDEPTYYSSPGYAALGVDTNGYRKAGAVGRITQVVTIPTGATRGRFSLYYNLATDDYIGNYSDFALAITASSTCNDVDLITGFSPLIPAHMSANGVYRQMALDFSVAAYSGQRVCVYLGGSADVSKLTILRIDDVKFEVWSE